VLCLLAGGAHHHQIIGVSHEHTYALGVPLPVEPVQIDVAEQRGEDSPNAIGNFEFDISLPYLRGEKPHRRSTAQSDIKGNL